jgi:hypothetical protein
MDTFTKLTLLYVTLLILAFVWWRRQIQYRCPSIRDATEVNVKPGTLVFMHTMKKEWSFSWWDHVAIVFRDRDEILKVADVTPCLKNPVSIKHWDQFLHSSSRSSAICIRDLKDDLTQDQSRNLTEYIHERGDNLKFNPDYMLTWGFGQLRIGINDEQEYCLSFVLKCLKRAGVRVPTKAYDNMNAVNITDVSSSEWPASAPDCPFLDEIYLDRRKVRKIYYVM